METSWGNVAGWYDNLLEQSDGTGKGNLPISAYGAQSYSHHYVSYFA
jgi:hypothetical protein